MAIEDDIHYAKEELKKLEQKKAEQDLENAKHAVEEAENARRKLNQ